LGRFTHHLLTLCATTGAPRGVDVSKLRREI